MLPNEYEVDPQYHLLAKRLACKRARQWGLLQHQDDMIGVAYLALITAARTYDSSFGASFKTRLFSVVNRALMDFGRSIRPKGFRRMSQVLKQQDNTRRECKVVSIEDYEEGPHHSLYKIGATLTSEDEPVGWEIESLDEVEGLIRILSPARAAMLRRRFTVAGMSVERLRAELGISATWVTKQTQESLARLRKEVER